MEVERREGDFARGHFRHATGQSTCLAADGLITHAQLKKVAYDTPQGIVEAIAPAAETVWDEIASRPVPEVDAAGAAIRADFLAKGAAI